MKALSGRCAPDGATELISYSRRFWSSLLRLDRHMESSMTAYEAAIRRYQTSTAAVAATSRVVFHMELCEAVAEVRAALKELRMLEKKALAPMTRRSTSMKDCEATQRPRVDLRSRRNRSSGGRPRGKTFDPDSLPTDWAIERVKDEGSREAAILADHDRLFSVKFEESMREVEDLKICTASRSRNGLQHGCREMRFCDDSAD